jgi:predicted amidophosphoribosyltransferase
MYRQLMDRAAALVAPPLCVACRKASDPGSRLCLQCRAALASMPVGLDRRDAFAAFPYEDRARLVVGALKFRQAPGVAGEMAELMLPRLPAWAIEAELIVPVPAHPARRRARGYNQSLLIARALAAGTGARVVDCLRRAPLAPPQSELSRAQRLRLPKSTFSVGGAGIESSTAAVLLCDDVTTTGVTFEACARALGSTSVRSVAFAATGEHLGSGAQIL